MQAVLKAQERAVLEEFLSIFRHVLDIVDQRMAGVDAANQHTDLVQQTLSPSRHAAAGTGASAQGMLHAHLTAAEGQTPVVPSLLPLELPPSADAAGPGPINVSPSLDNVQQQQQDKQQQEQKEMQGDWASLPCVSIGPGTQAEPGVNEGQAGVQLQQQQLLVAVERADVPCEGYGEANPASQGLKMDEALPGG